MTITNGDGVYLLEAISPSSIEDLGDALDDCEFSLRSPDEDMSSEQWHFSSSDALTQQGYVPVGGVED
jgi:hypothetical protein